MSLKEKYNLSYDSSGFNSGLIDWYNKLIDKSYEAISIEDIAKMIRQDILKDIAIVKAVDLFFEDPFDGEYDDGDLLNSLASLEFKNIDNKKILKLKQQLNNLQSTYLEFEWEQVELKERFKKDLDKILQKLNVSEEGWVTP